MEKPKILHVPWTQTKRGDAGGRGGDAGRKGERGEKNWDNCNSIINKIYFKKENHIKPNLKQMMMRMIIITINKG